MSPIDRASIRRQHRHPEIRSDRHPIAILADNVDKISNMGAILRTAEAFRCERVVTNRERADSMGAMGAQHWQPVEWGTDLLARAREYKRLGYSLVVLEQHENARPIDSFLFPGKVALVVGAEMFGVSSELIGAANALIFIPQAGLVKSLNVAAATAIALYEYSRQHWMRGFAQPIRNLEPSMASVRLPRGGVTVTDSRHG